MIQPLAKNFNQTIDFTGLIAIFSVISNL